ncbi:MAG: alcohol dehydrogenase catalytic domain-containing protein [Spirochaetaceae bacterium]|nr:MAG: alcohol dehydrogenase catalytic domain-containing protein [Spirochaetaceae bacterium]
MKAAVLVAPGTLEIREVPKPLIKPDEILVHVVACAICGTDLRIFRHGHSSIKLPAIIGHEIVGQVEEVGAKFPVKEVEYGPGTMVMVTPGIPCGRCRNCLRGLFCANKTSIAYHYPGGFAEYLRIPAQGVRSNVFPLPDPLPEGQKPADYTIAEPLACALNGLERLGTLPVGGQGLVVGAGVIGVLLTRLLFKNGLARVAVADISAHRLHRIKDILPADTILINNGNEDLQVRSREITGGEGFDVVVVACSSSEIQEKSLELIGLYGKILYFAGLPPNHPLISFNSNLLHYKLASVRGTYGSILPQNRRAMDLVASGFTDGLCDSRYPLERITEAFQSAAEGRALKCVVEP